MSLVFFPVVGALVGLLAGAAYLASARLGLAPLACAAIAIGVSAMVTGCFHEDGLADVADAMGKLDRDGALAVMRDSRIGSFGAVAIWVALSVKAAALTQIPVAHVLLWLVLAGAFSRAAPTAVVALLKQARVEAGRSSSSVAGAGILEACLAFAIAFAGAWLLADPVLAATLLAATAIVVSITALFYKMRFGGYTGDCLGTTTVVAEIVILCLLAVSH
jgi:adenosylcobinamide-GDP ribazoletransferase